MKSLSGAQQAILMDIAMTVTPEVAGLDGAGLERMAAIIDTALQDRDPGMRKQFGTFLTVIRMAPLLRYGRRFDGLDAARKDAVLRWFQDGPVGLFRQGFWGLKALVFMGYYGQPEIRSEVGYAPDFDGREGVHRA